MAEIKSWIQDQRQGGLGPCLCSQKQINKTPDHLSSAFWIVEGADLSSRSSKHRSQYLRE